MKLTRRTFIRVAGTGTVIAAAGVGAFAATRTPSAALAPWEMAGKGYTDPRMRALSYAILAPNPHNRQPWMVDLGTPGRITLLCDLERRLPETDPFDRQILIGLGCFLEILRMAAAEQGLRADIAPFPEGLPDRRLDARPVATIRLSRAPVGKDPLFRHVLARRSNKEPYDMARQVGDALLAALRAAARAPATVGGTNDPARVGALRKLAWDGHLIEVKTPRTMMESVRLMRIGRSEIEAKPDGIDIGGFFPESLNLLGILTRKTIADPKSSAFEQGLEMYREIHKSAMGYVWITTGGNRRADQLAAGRDWVRINLAATAAGASVHPVSQTLQEYPEMKALHSRVHRMLGAQGAERVQMLARVGYGPRIDPSPRWKLTTRIRQGG